MKYVVDILFEKAPDAMLLTDAYGKIVLVNDQVCKMFGYEKGELIGTEVELLMPQASRDLHKHHRSEFNSHPRTLPMGSGLELSGRRRNGTEFYAEISLSPFSVDGDFYVAAAIRDVTERRILIHEMQARKEQISEQNKRLINFAHVVSHNLRNHAVNFTALLDMLEKTEATAEQAQIKGYLRKVSTALTETVQDLTESVFSDESYLRRKLNLHAFIWKAIETLSGEIKQYGAIVNCNVDEGLAVSYNPAYLESILLNLFSNAIKYRHPERAPVIAVDAFIFKGKVVLMISDNGRGIDLEKHGNKLFQMYQTFHGNGDAHGVGLFIVKNQVETMGVKIEVTSSVNCGTSFKVTLG